MGSKQSIEDKARVNAIQSALNTWDTKSVEDTAEAFKTEIDAGMDVNQRLSSGNTLLTAICSLECEDDEQQQKRLQLLEKSFDLGANVNTKNRSGDTPLIIAAKSDDTGMIQSLLIHGANTHDENKSSFNAAQLGSASGTKYIEDWLAKCSQEIKAMFARVTENQSEATVESIKPFINDRLGWVRYLPQEKRQKYEILQHSLSIAKSNTRGSVKIDGQIQFEITTPRDNNEAADNSIHVIRKLLHQKEYLELDSIRIDVGKRKSFKLENLLIHKSLFVMQQAKKIVQGEDHIMELITKLGLSEEDKIPILVLCCNSAWVENERLTPATILQEIILPGLVRLCSFERLPSWYEASVIEWLDAKASGKEQTMSS